ncbi:hypothetical protein [Algoriphagus boritolerans]|uniref:hypothetical protein n=1 Tax=Algoriphagus boritolerans TaxID=308111 RepID=UPI002FCE39E4
MSIINSNPNFQLKSPHEKIPSPGLAPLPDRNFCASAGDQTHVLEGRRHLEIHANSAFKLSPDGQWMLMP